MAEPPATYVMPPDTGSEILGQRYRLEGLLGTGGMARVYRAFDLRLERPVAVKMLSESPSADRTRFAAEVRTIALFDHPNLVRLLDADVEHGTAYLVMDLVEGPTLSRRWRDLRLDERDVATIGAGIAAALSYVHDRGVVHRDVKPANILLGSDGRPRLADFGIARLVGGAGLTSTGMTIGTPAYLAPEQVASEEVGPPADVYALGLVLAEALTGEPVFQGTPSEVAVARLHGTAELGAVPPIWRPLLQAMTSRAPHDRPSAADVEVSLEDLAERTRELPVTPTAVMAAPALGAGALQAAPLASLAAVETPPVAGAGGAAGGVRQNRGAGRGAAERWRVWGLILGGCALLALVLALALGNGPVTPPAKPSTHHSTTTVPPASTTTVPATTTTSTTTTTTSTTTTTTTVPPGHRHHKGGGGNGGDGGGGGNGGG